MNTLRGPVEMQFFCDGDELDKQPVSIMRSLGYQKNESEIPTLSLIPPAKLRKASANRSAQVQYPASRLADIFNICRKTFESEWHDYARYLY